MAVKPTREQRRAFFAEVAALHRKWGYEEDAQLMESLASAPDAEWSDRLRVGLHDKFTELQMSEKGASVVELLTRKVAEKSKEIERLAAERDAERDIAGDTPNVLVARSLVRVWQIERDRLVAQDEVHWKTRRSLVAECDRLRAALEKITDLQGKRSDQLLMDAMGIARKALAGAADECEWCARGNEPLNGVHKVDRGLQYLVCKRAGALAAAGDSPPSTPSGGTR